MSFLDYKEKILCASKYFSIDEIIKIHHLGITMFGENYVKDLLSKKNKLKDYPKIKWHFIGNLQSNKIKMVINEIDAFETLTSLKQAKLIQKHRIKPLDTYIQINLSDNSRKQGVLVKDLDLFIQEIEKYDKINLIGLMTMGIYNNQKETDIIFKTLNELKIKYNLKKTSMGMSGDYKIALKHQSDLLRIGSLFKEVI